MTGKGLLVTGTGGSQQGAPPQGSTPSRLTPPVQQRRCSSSRTAFIVTYRAGREQAEWRKPHAAPPCRHPALGSKAVWLRASVGVSACGPWPQVTDRFRPASLQPLALGLLCLYTGGPALDPPLQGRPQHRSGLAFGGLPPALPGSSSLTNCPEMWLHTWLPWAPPLSNLPYIRSLPTRVFHFCRSRKAWTQICSWEIPNGGVPAPCRLGSPGPGEQPGSVPSPYDAASSRVGQPWPWTAGVPLA